MEDLLTLLARKKKKKDFSTDFFRLLIFLQVAVPLKGHLDNHVKSEMVT